MSSTKKQIVSQARRYEQLTDSSESAWLRVERVLPDPGSIESELEEALWLDDDHELDDRGKILNSEQIGEASSLLARVQKDIRELRAFDSAVVSYRGLLDSRESALKALIAKMRSYDGETS